MSELPTPETAYDDVWKPIIEETGEVNYDTVKSLLFDYGAMLHSNSILYPYLTEGRITHPQHDVEDVISANDAFIAAVVDQGIQTILSHLLDKLATVSTESAEVQLETVVREITSLYENPNV